MKTVLIITSIDRASWRMINLAKYLPEHEWNAIIISPEHDHECDERIKIITTKYKPTLDARILSKTQINAQTGFEGVIPTTSIATDIAKKILSIGRSILWFPDRDRGWKQFGIGAGSHLIESQKIDALISSSSPETSHIIARTLHNKYKLPWIADLRDLWSQNHNYPYGRVRHTMDSYVERTTLNDASALVTVSAPLAVILYKRYPHIPIRAITNGFDPDLLNMDTPVANKFVLTYTGKLYHGKQDVEMLFLALVQLIRFQRVDRSRVEVHLFCPSYPWLSDLIKTHNLSDVIKLCGIIPHNEIIHAQRSSQVLLLFDWNDPLVDGVYTRKFFEYLAARRPILVVGGSGISSVSQVVRETCVGGTATSVFGCMNNIHVLYAEFTARGEVAFHGDFSIMKYNHRNMTRKFVDILENI